VVLGVPPTRAETGYGYIELCETVGPECVPCQGVPVRRVKRFTEKPDRARAEEFLASGNYAWNGGIFLWSAKTLANAIREHCPEMGPALERIAAAHKASESELDSALEFERIFADVYPLCQNISVDYAVLEPRSAKGELHSEIYCLPADFGWNDIGSWAALHEHRADCAPEINVCDGVNGAPLAIDAKGNYVFAPGKTVALLGVSDLVVVETVDALLITTRERSQDVGKVVAELKAQGREDLI
jgi:mannose-1-phosphate guanylyltransferase